MPRARRGAGSPVTRWCRGPGYHDAAGDCCRDERHAFLIDRARVSVADPVPGGLPRAPAGFVRMRCEVAVPGRGPWAFSQVVSEEALRSPRDRAAVEGYLREETVRLLEEELDREPVAGVRATAGPALPRVTGVDWAVGGARAQAEREERAWRQRRKAGDDRRRENVLCPCGRRH